MRTVAVDFAVSLALPVAQAARQDAPTPLAGLQGDWAATKLITAKGVLDFNPGVSSFTLKVEGDSYTFRSPDGTGKGKVVVDSKAGRLDLRGKGSTLSCTYALLKDGRLILTVWPSPEARA